jgi:hypothetical protein
LANGALAEADAHKLGGVAEADVLPRLAAPVRAALWVAGFMLALWLAVQWGANASVHNDFTQNVWLPARLVLDGVSPYNPSRAQVDAALGAYSAEFTAFNSGATYNFIYPIWVALVMSPFGAMPLAVATAVWRAANLMLLVWGLSAVLRASNPTFRLTRVSVLAAVAVTALLGVIYRPSLLALYLGQFAIIELGLLAAIWGWLITSAQLDGRRRVWGDVLAGLALAVLATKPQAVGLPVLLIVTWAFSRRRWAIPAGTAASLALLLLVPLIFYRSSLGEWLGIVLGSGGTRGQAFSQAQVSASVWGLSYQALGGTWLWAPLAAAASLGILALLVPGWRRDLADRVSPVPMALPFTLCANIVVSPYMLGYEHVLLLLPAMVLLAMVGLPSEQAEPNLARSRQLWRLALYTWLAILPWLVVAVQSVLSAVPGQEYEYVAIAQSASMLALCGPSAARILGSRHTL